MESRHSQLSILSGPGLFTEMLRSNVPLGSMGFSAAALAFGYGHQWQEMFRILEATLLQIFFFGKVWYSNCLFFFPVFET